MNERLTNLLKSLGPGILFASTCIGVSHLVQSTRAGAVYGFGLLWAVAAANLFKYPFFEFGSRYANATGESIIDGYRRTGKWMLWLYFILTLASMFFVAAAVGAVTAGFMDNLFGVSALLGNRGIWWTTGILFSICIGILLAGKYGALDSLIKVIGTVLLISTVLAVVLTLNKGPATDEPFNWLNTKVLNPEHMGFPFLIALMGWMPSAIDLSSWNSLWTLERIKQTGYRPKLSETLFDFNFGYIASAVLGPCFLILGAFLIFGTDKTMPHGSGDFANAVIGLYTETMGDWSYFLIAASAFSIMFGTCIAIFDGYSRVMERTLKLLTKWPQAAHDDPETILDSNSKTYNFTLLLVGVGAFGIIYFFGESLKNLVDLSTTISFLIAPLIAFINFKLVSGKLMPKHGRPPKWLRWLAIAGIVFLTSFALIFIWWKLL
ncbi:Nramp family divalent metal transporter [Halocola ammonii]